MSSTDRSSSSYTARLRARAIAANNADAIASNKRAAATNLDASLTHSIDIGALASECCTSGGGSPPPPPPPSDPVYGFVPTTWIDAGGVDFDSMGRSVAYGNGKWIACGIDATNTIKMSTDGALTWSDVDNQMPAGSGWSGAYGVATDGQGNWVAVGNKNTEAGAKTILFSSDNGLTWNSNSAYDAGFNSPNGTTDRGYNVTYANGLWVAVGHYAQSPIQWERTIKIANTFDPVTGPNWSSSPPGYGNSPVFGSSNPALGAAYGNGVWLVCGQDENMVAKGSIFYSTDNCTSWTKATNSFKGTCYSIATDGSGNWVAVGNRRYSGGGYVDAKTIKYSSDNGVTWTDCATDMTNLFSMGTSVAYMPREGTTGVWVATGTGNSQTILYSTDNGVTWIPAGSNRFTSGGYDIYFGGDRWVAVGQGGASSIKYSLI